MSSIDWSNPEEMLGLLIEYVADESSASHDPERVDFLQGLLSDLENVVNQEFVAIHQVADAIRETRESQPREFLNDEVIAHVDACIEELYRIESGVRLV